MQDILGNFLNIGKYVLENHLEMYVIQHLHMNVMSYVKLYALIFNA